VVGPNVVPRRWIVTGERGAGKTTFCRTLVDSACNAGWDAAGLLSLPRYQDLAKTGIQILDLRSRAVRLLASRLPDELEGFRFCGWTFNEAALAWGNDVFRRATPCDLLVVDEAGPLEFDAGKGMTMCFSQLESNAYRLAIAVVRPSYQERFAESWTESVVVTVTSPQQAILSARKMFAEFHLPA
jgi:nucleoside-triphosphatase